MAAVPAMHRMVLDHHEFDSPSFVPAVGDSITIINRSDIAHNIYATYEDGRMVTLDTQPPGTEKTLLLEEAGTVLLRCWIHPVIRMALTVISPG